jgi:hypothetical protein
VSVGSRASRASIGRCDSVNILSDDWISASSAIALLKAVMGSLRRRPSQPALTTALFDPELSDFFAAAVLKTTSNCRKSFGGLADVSHLIRIGQREISTLILTNMSTGELTVSVFCAPKSRK